MVVRSHLVGVGAGARLGLRLVRLGLPAEAAAAFAGMDPAIARGALVSQSTDLQDLIGRPSTPPAEALAA